MTRGPDFIIIGGMKCATSTLHEQLARQPGFFMSTPKEPSFFSDDAVYARGAVWYASLFRGAAAGDLCGESSTHYTKLPTYPRTIERMLTHVPDVKLIYVMRHPISRLVSQYIHEWTQRLVAGPIDEAIDAFPAMIDYSRYAMQLRPYLEAFGPERVLPVFFERLTCDPQSELERVCRFLGYAGQPVWDADLGAANVSSERMRCSAWRDRIVYAPLVTSLRRGLIPQSVRDRIKRLWTLKQRPQIGPAQMERLRWIFDEDLATLGEWLGLALNCDNYKDVVTRGPLTWTAGLDSSAESEVAEPARKIGVVTIGRNEGERLRRCLTSLKDQAERIVYVDSGSSDGSVAMAESMGVDVVRLDTSIPFTMARARNMGFARLMAGGRELKYVQFVDGDCEVVEGWLKRAARALEEAPGAAVVCGRRRERWPEASVYNRLCDLEWDTPVGEARACGGDALMRTEAFFAVAGYNPCLIAGEEPELCVRLRSRGWKVVRVDAEMTLHDAAMTRFGQWWRRSVRAGYAYAQGAALHGGPRERHCVRERRSNWLWGAVVPAAALLGAWPTGGLSLALLGAYPLLAWRVQRSVRRQGRTARQRWLYAGFCVAGKLPQAVGQGRYELGRLRSRPSGLIEYKTATG